MVINTTFLLENGAYITSAQCIGEEEKKAESELVRLGSTPTLPNTCAWLENTAANYIFFQVLSPNDGPVGQFAVYIFRPKKAPWYSWGRIEQWSNLFVCEKTESLVLKNISEIINKFTKISHIEINFYQLPNGLGKKIALAQTAELTPVPLVNTYRKTAYCNVEHNPDHYLSQVSAKTRAKIRHRTRDDVLIQRIFDAKYSSMLQACLDEAFSRTGGVSQKFPFKDYIKLSSAYPDKCLVLGLSFKDTPDEIIAYSIDVNHGFHVEAVSSGSLANQRLRKIHFNYYLFWEKYLWASRCGAKYIDLGGITSGDANDHLASISAFKRHLSNCEAEVSIQYRKVCRPPSYSMYQLVNTLNRFL